MKMRHEFNHIRKYNSSIINCIVESNSCNKRLRAKLEELEYYKIAKPIEGLNEFYQVIIRQVIINKMIELYEELERIRIKLRCLATRQSLAQFLSDLYTDQY